MPTTLVFAESKQYSRYNSRNYYVFTWTHLHDTDLTPDTVRIPSNIKLSLKAAGTWGVAGHLKLQGSMDGTTWFDLKDTADATIALEGDGTALVEQDNVWQYIRPLVSAGTGVDITVTVLAIP